MAEILARTFQRSAPAAAWESANSILGKGEIGYDETNNQARIGDGVKRWLQLPPIGVTAGQIETIITSYLAANPPTPAPSTGGSTTVSAQDIAPGVVRITIEGAAAGGGSTGGGSTGGGSTTPVAPAITTDPAVSSYAPAGSRVTFAAAASGSPLNYQWYRSTNFADWTAISGATGSSYQTPALSMSDHESYYRCVVSNSAGTSISGGARLRVSPTGAPTITSQPVSPAPTPFDTDATLSVSADNATSITWESTSSAPDAPDAEWTALANKSGSPVSIRVNALNPVGSLFYRAKVSNATASVYSNAVRIQASDNGNSFPRALPGLPRYIIAAPGSTRALSMGSTTGTGPITYRWRDSAYYFFLAETSSVLTLTSLSPAISGTTFTGEALGYQGSSSASGCTIIVPNPAGPTILRQPERGETYAGGSLTVAVSAVGGTITYQWQTSANGTSGWSNVAGATSATYGGASQSAYYRCVLTNAAGTITTRSVFLSFSGD